MTHPVTLRRALWCTTALSAAWAVVVALTGGFAYRSDWLRLSSQQPVDPAFIALACAAIAVALDWTPSSPKRAARALLAIVTALGSLLIILQWADARPLWLDEEMIALNYRDRAMIHLAGPLWLDQAAPLGWLMVQRMSLLLLGSSELAVRLVPSLFGIGTLLCAAWIGHRWMTPIGATVLVLLCSFGQWLSFYSVELKHYSADTLFALLLPSLAVWVADSGTDAALKRRLPAWGIVAALAQWLSVGALLVSPACGIFLAATVFRRYRFRSLHHVALFSLPVGVSFALHYAASMRHARESRFFQEFWTFAFPPLSADIRAIFSWFGGQLEPFAAKPGGSGHWMAFWLTALCGFALARRPGLGIMGALVAISGFAFTALRIFPFYERLSLWFLTSIYLGIALFADSAASFAYRARTSQRAFNLLCAAAVGGLAFYFCADVLRKGLDDVRTTRPPDTNRDLDDRNAITWLLEQRGPADVIVTTRFGLPAVWWYAQAPVSNGGGRLPDGTPLFVVDHQMEADCLSSVPAEARKERARVLLHLGFEDFPKGFDDLVLRELASIGGVDALRHFGPLSRAAIIDLRTPPDRQPAYWSDHDGAASTPLPGCLSVRAAARW